MITPSTQPGMLAPERCGAGVRGASADGAAADEQSHKGEGGTETKKRKEGKKPFQKLGCTH